MESAHALCHSWHDCKYATTSAVLCDISALNTQVTVKNCALTEPSITEHAQCILLI
jgi:hypothetical protein